MDEVVSDTLELFLGDAPPGDYQLAIGLYDATTGARLSAWALDGGHLKEQELVLPDVVEVREGEGRVKPLEESYPDASGLRGVVVEDVRLVFVVDGYLPTEVSPGMDLTTELCYLLSGYSSDGRYRVTFHLRAVELSK